MESERMDDHDALRAVARVRLRAAASGRAFAWLNLWSGVMLGAYIGLFTTITTVGPVPTDAQPSQMLLPVLLLHGAIVEGAKERAGIHRPLRAADIVMLVLAIAVVIALFAASLLGASAPWFGPAAGVIGLLVCSAVPLTRLLRIERARRGEPLAQDWPTAPLSRPALVLTLGAAALLGATVVGQGGAIASLAIIGAVLVLLFVALAAKETAWSPARAGLEWGRRQWAGFGVSVFLLFGDVALVAFAGPQPFPAAVALAALVAAPLALSALARRAS
jgi:hypothetical protein